MGILDDLKHKVEKLGDKAREGFDGAKDRLGHSDDASDPLGESADAGPDSTSTDAVQPGYVTAEDDADDPESGEDSLDDSGDADDSDVVPPAAAELDPVELDAAESIASDSDPQTGPATATGPAVETNVDPYDQPLTESIGDEIAAALVNSEAVAEAVDAASTERESAD